MDNFRIIANVRNCNLELVIIMNMRTNSLVATDILVQNLLLFIVAKIDKHVAA